MPIKRSKVNQEGVLRDLSVKFGDEYLNLKYSRSKYTPALERRLKEHLDQKMPGHMLAEMLMVCLVEWDLVDVHPEDVDLPESSQRLIPVPLTPETLSSLLSIEAQAKIVEQLSADQSPNQTTSVPSNDTF